MDEMTLIGRLRALDPPDTELGKRRALEVVPARVRAALTGRPGRARRLWPRLASALALALVALVGFSALTAPGHALTNWVGDRLGLGQPGGPPGLQSLRESWTQGEEGESQAHVLVRGPGPLGGDYEFITFRAAGGLLCFELQFPDARNLFTAGCGLPSEKDGLLLAGVGGNSAPGPGYQFASGRVGENVAAVDLEVDGQAVPVELRSIPADLIERFDIPRPFKFFIALLDPDLHEGTVTVTARDAAGNPVASKTSALFGMPVPGE